MCLIFMCKLKLLPNVHFIDVQYVTEKTGKASVVTEYDSDYETLCSQLDLIKTATEKMVSYVETVAEPNPSE